MGRRWRPRVPGRRHRALLGFAVLLGFALLAVVGYGRARRQAPGADLAGRPFTGCTSTLYQRAAEPAT